MSKYYMAELRIIVGREGKLNTQELAKLIRQAGKEKINQVTADNVMDIVTPVEEKEIAS